MLDFTCTLAGSVLHSSSLCLKKAPASPDTPVGAKWFSVTLICICGRCSHSLNGGGEQCDMQQMQ